ncbi:MAG: imidazolonepropionase [Candidatus Neomarinimicrobiota bacterium]|nr:MAG: imidazolonepropionase [Candidatus Neomarinimicrobiota bacterium]
MRLKGSTYEDIAASGGGIRGSVSDLRNVDFSLLVSKLKSRMDSFLRFGTTTVECKSGYGLNIESELKSLKAINEVNNSHPIKMIPTFMGAHAFPNEYEKNREGYVNLICDEMIPRVAKQGIAVFIDVFCEKGYFNPEQSRRILNVGKKFGLIPRMHADEFQNSKSAEISGEIKSISADHLMMVSEEGIKALNENNVIATLLPGTTFFLGQSNYAPYTRLKEAGVEIALATDFNPGSCSIQSMPFIISLACLFLKMDILEAVKACTYTSAKSLMLEDTIGSIEEGKKADLIIWEIDKIENVPYLVDSTPIRNVLKNGSEVFTA